MSRYKRQQGSITVETSIVLPIFILLFLFIFGLFSIVGAQNQMTHALIQSTRSLSLDSYLTEHVDSVAEGGTIIWGDTSDMVLDIIRLDNDENFSSRTDWYSASDENSEVVKRRFVGYLSGGDEGAAREKLEDMKIVGGLDGITFKTEIDDETITVTMKYEMQYWFDFWGTGKIPMEQSIKSRLWK